MSILIGTVLGFLSGLGIGGGSLLIVWLTAVVGITPQTARGINLLFFLPAAILVSLFRIRQGSLNWKVIFPAALFGCLCAAASSWLGYQIQLDLLKKLFGGLLIIIGIRELLYRDKK